jgi:hypothetical protein
VADLRRPLHRLGDEVGRLEVGADGDDAVVGEKDRPAPGLGAQRAQHLIGQFGGPGRRVVGDEHAVGARRDVLVADEREIEPGHRERGGVPRMGVHDGAEVRPRRHQPGVEGDLAGRRPPSVPGSVPVIDDGVVVGAELVVTHAGGADDEAVVVDADADVAGGSDHETVGDHPHAGGVDCRSRGRRIQTGGDGHLPILRSVPMRTIEWRDDHERDLGAASLGIRDGARPECRLGRSAPRCGGRDSAGAQGPHRFA